MEPDRAEEVGLLGPLTTMWCGRLDPTGSRTWSQAHTLYDPMEDELGPPRALNCRINRV